MKTEMVVGFMFASNTNEVLLVEKLKPEWIAGKLNGIGGKVREGETPFEAMCREFIEETKQKTCKEDWKMFCTIEGIDYIVYFFRSDIMTSEGILALPDENDVGEKLILGTGSYIAVKVDMMVPDLQWLIPLAKDKDIEGCVDVKHKDSFRFHHEEKQ